MMKTAVERASRPLKFWILGNFLSPAFRHAVNSGALATAVGAQVAIVQYDWPSHLREQTEKQRLIWGYKILFLDVLFPQSLRKIIFVEELIAS
ncbi:udp-glucose glycoprotein:glucosyltransferase [Chrysochromulina tobinii]|uniref:Udp-glucose glycoprotein:glucosyltransferase n=1 Tax=Chrysochromulina tobinii TaxID=1460289 RepID=A0A0M0LQW8_9EUKA|nr:udp-glucose glycoprotein:glucosyltransferase [Chrysochromulina tobinii]|eukprot:KOO53434.1 udp-glucose glycoprotein:glucosyltransferase [Chrysochromulina sp. CCMP291]